MNKENAIEKLNTIINTNPYCGKEGTTTVRISDEDYDYTITRKDKVKYLPLSSIEFGKKYKVIPKQTQWEKWHNISFSHVVKIHPFEIMETLSKLFPRDAYSYESRSKMYYHLPHELDNLYDNNGIDKALMVFIGKDASNKDVLELMTIDQDSSFFNDKRVIVKGKHHDWSNY